MQEKTITALCDALTRQQLPFVQGEPLAAHTTFRIGGPAVMRTTSVPASEDSI